MTFNEAKAAMGSTVCHVSTGGVFNCKVYSVLESTKRVVVQYSCGMRSDPINPEALRPVKITNAVAVNQYAIHDN